MAQPLVILAGPTGVGKTALSLALAKAHHGEVISCDATQVYRGLDVGSAKLPLDQREGVPHHLIDVADPHESYSAARFAEEAQRAAKDIAKRGHLPILCGGTGLYIDAVLYEMNFGGAPSSRKVRDRLEDLAKEEGPLALHERLRQCDHKTASAIHPNNVRRVIRALEVFELTGQPFSSFSSSKKLNPLWTPFYYWLSMDRAALYERINQRVDQMMQEGLLQEVAGLFAQGCHKELQSMQAIGYKELILYLEGSLSLAEAVEKIKQNTRNYAKRQITWFRREEIARKLERERMTDEEMLFRIEDDMNISHE